MPANTRMKRIFLEGLLWLYLLEFGLTVLSLEPGFLDFDNLPETNFTCVGKVIGGYYADLETNCQMFHVCTIGQLDEPMDIRFLCLNGTVFDQETRVCERIDEVDCSKSEQFYSLNLELYGNSQPILEESPDAPETEQPLVIKSTTTTTTTTTRRPSTNPTRPQYFSTSSLPTATSSGGKHQIVHHFPVTSSDIRFNPEEINISLNAGSPPDIRTNRFSYSDHSDSAKVQSSNQEHKRPHVVSSTTSKSVFSVDSSNRKLPQTSDINYDFSNADYNTEYPQVFHYDSRHSNFLPRITQDVYHNRQYQNDKLHPSTIRPSFVQSLKPPDLHEQDHYNSQTEKPPQRLQIPIPLLPTLPPLIFSSPAPFTLHRHVDAKRYTKDHQTPPRIIISASASVTDDSGRRLNYSLGTIGAAQILETPPSSYDEYKDTDVGLDPFYHDVPKLKHNRRRRSVETTNGNLNPFEVIRNEQEAVKVLKFLFTWYKNHQATATAPPVTIPVSPDLITKINHEFSPLAEDNSDSHYINSREATNNTTPSLEALSENHESLKTLGKGEESTKNDSSWYINPHDYVDDNYEPQTFKDNKEVGQSDILKVPIQLPDLEVTRDEERRVEDEKTTEKESSLNDKELFGSIDSQNVPQESHNLEEIGKSHNLNSPVPDSEVIPNEEQHVENIKTTEKSSSSDDNRLLGLAESANVEQDSRNLEEYGKNHSLKLPVQLEVSPEREHVKDDRPPEKQSSNDYQLFGLIENQTVPPDFHNLTDIVEKVTVSLPDLEITPDVVTGKTTENESSSIDAGLFGFIDNRYVKQENFKSSVQLTDLEVTPKDEHHVDDRTGKEESSTYDNRGTLVENYNLKETSLSNEKENSESLTTSTTETPQLDRNIRRRGRGRYRYSSRVSQQQEHHQKGDREDGDTKSIYEAEIIRTRVQRPSTERPLHRNSRKRGRSRFTSSVTPETPTSKAETIETTKIPLETSTVYLQTTTKEPKVHPELTSDQDSEQSKVPELETNGNDTVEINLSSPNSINALQDLKDIFQQSEVVDEQGNIKDGSEIFKNLQNTFDSNLDQIEEIKTSYKEPHDLTTTTIHSTTISNDGPQVPITFEDQNTESDFEIFKSVTYEPVTIDDRPENATEETILPIYFQTREPDKESNHSNTDINSYRPNSFDSPKAVDKLPPVDDTTVTTPLVNFEVSESFATTFAPLTEETLIDSSNYADSFTTTAIPSTDDHQKVSIRPSLITSKHNKIPAFIIDNYMKNPYLQYDNTKYATPKTNEDNAGEDNSTKIPLETSSPQENEQNSTLNTSTTESILNKHANYLVVLSKVFENIYSPHQPGTEEHHEDDVMTKDLVEPTTTETVEVETTTQSTIRPTGNGRTRGRSRYLDHYRSSHHVTTSPKSLGSAFNGIFQNILYQTFSRTKDQTDNPSTPLEQTTSSSLGELIQEIEATTGSVSVTEYPSMTKLEDETETTTLAPATEPSEEKPDKIENEDSFDTTSVPQTTETVDEMPKKIKTYAGINLDELGITSTPSPFSKRPKVDEDLITTTPAMEMPSLDIFNSSHLLQVLVETTAPPNVVTSTMTEQYYRRRPSQRRPNVKNRQFGRHRFSTELFTQKPIEEKQQITDAPLHRSAAPTQAEVKKISLHTTPLSWRNNRHSTKVSKTYFFNCFGKEINKFYADPRDCRLFHYCTQGYSKNQLLDLKYVCDLKTYFDDEKLICTKVKPRRCL